MGTLDSSDGDSTPTEVEPSPQSQSANSSPICLRKDGVSSVRPVDITLQCLNTRQGSSNLVEAKNENIKEVDKVLGILSTPLSSVFIG